MLCFFLQENHRPDYMDELVEAFAIAMSMAGYTVKKDYTGQFLCLTEQQFSMFDTFKENSAQRQAVYGIATNLFLNSDQARYADFAGSLFKLKDPQWHIQVIAILHCK